MDLIFNRHKKRADINWWMIMMILGVIALVVIIYMFMKPSKSLSSAITCPDSQCAVDQTCAAFMKDPSYVESFLKCEKTVNKVKQRGTCCEKDNS